MANLDHDRQRPARADWLLRQGPLSSGPVSANTAALSTGAEPQRVQIDDGIGDDLQHLDHRVLEPT